MGNAKHTPVPLHQDYGCGYDEREICILKVDRHESNPLSPVERDANIAHAIACWNAAPDMLEALKGFVDDLQRRLDGRLGRDDIAVIFDNARAAISKAERAERAPPAEGGARAV